MRNFAGSAPEVGLLGGLGVLKRKQFRFIFAPFITLLFTVSFACHFMVSGDFFPAGQMAILGLVALVLFNRALPSREGL